MLDSTQVSSIVTGKMILLFLNKKRHEEGKSHIAVR